MLIKKDLNLNPDFNFFNGYLPFSYFIFLCTIHHNHSDGFEPISHRVITPMICSQDRIRTCMIEKTNFTRFFGMVNILNVMSHGPINQSPITRLPITPPDQRNFYSHRSYQPSVVRTGFEPVSTP